MSDFRLHLADLIDNPIKTAADVQAGLDKWREINSDPNRWARFEAMQFEHERVVNVHWGNVLSGAFKECALQTISFKLQPDGSVYVGRQTHS
jgi:hypothetical protein